MDFAASWSGLLANPVIQLALPLAGVSFAGLYAASVIWTVRDARHHIANALVAYTLSSLALLPYLGVLVYLILRPPDALSDVRQRNLSQLALLAEAERRRVCPTCALRVESAWLLCPACRTSLSRACLSCGTLVPQKWDICMRCGMDFGRGETAVRRRRAAVRLAGSQHRTAS